MNEIAPAETHASAPQPTLARWRPLRAGLINLYHYDEETFHFHQGRLLLRGNNGTGKSKVLALTLPLLLDAQFTPSRVEPDADPGKRMEWNLLMNGRYPERLGYSWLEFGRVTETGEPAFVTIGCGMRAVQGRGGVDRWFFTTSLRPGRELRLVERDFPLGRDRLSEALGSCGQVFQQAERYRRAVDEQLFGLGEERYRALVDLLVQLRQPQLSKRPDASALSNALTEALPPLDRTVLSDVAEALTDLEAERAELRSLSQSAEAVTTFLRHYRTYAGIAARRLGRDLRQAQSRFDTTSQSLRHTREQVESAESRELALETQRESARQAYRDARARGEALRQSPEMREAKNLDQAREHAASLDRMATEAEQDRAGREAELNAHATAQTRASAAADNTRSALQQVVDRLLQAASEAGVGAALERTLAPLALPDGPPQADTQPERAEANAAATVERRHQAAEHLRDLNRRLAETTQAARSVEERCDRLDAEVDAAERARREGETAVAAAGETLVAQYRKAFTGGKELIVPEPEVALDRLGDWVVTLDGANPALAAADAAREAAGRMLGQREGKLQEARAALDAERENLEVEHRRLEQGGEAPLPAAYWRDPAVRNERPGAPLWRLVDFQENVSAPQRAGVEAALEAAGLLDAWVTPEATVVAPDSGDILLRAGDENHGANLTRLLRPMVDRANAQAEAIGDATVAAVLATIGLDKDSGGVWVSPDGSFGLGPAQGRWTKEQAAFIGQSAREAARRRRLAELAGALEDNARQLQENAADLARVTEHRRTLQTEWAALPAGGALRDAHAEVARLMAERRRLDEALAAARQALDAAREAEGRVRDERDQAASDLHLPIDIAALQAVAAAVVACDRALAGLAPARRHHWSSIERLREAQAAHDHARVRREQASERATGHRRRARKARLGYETLRETVGARVEELQARLQAVEAQEQAAETAREEADAALRENGQTLGGLRTRVEEQSNRLGEEDIARRGAVAALQAFAEDGLLRTATPDMDIPEREGEWPLDATVRLARRLEERLAETDDSDKAWTQSRNGLLDHVTELQTALSRHGHEAHAENRGGGIVIRVVFHARPLSPDNLAAALAEEQAERARILDEREREILENHLINEVARHLQELIRDAEEQAGAINHELEERPTSTGMRLRIRWQPLAEGASDAIPSGLAEARRRLLRQTADAWSRDDREAVGGFLKAQIDRIHETAEDGTLLEHLERALDYRRWHRFSIERWQDGQWRPARGPASGGERVLTVTLPLFAAASSHYRSGSPNAPRLITLDEAFAGVDDDARAKCMGLLAHFDLDFVMTSEREWGCYRELPGLAIAHLSRFEGIDAVHVSRWRWDGRQRQPEPDPRRVERRPPETAATDGELPF